MLTMIMPALAVANWVMIHSARLVAQMARRSPFFRPRAMKPLAARFSSFCSSR